jgi:hypothetical protein
MAVLVGVEVPEVGIEVRRAETRPGGVLLLLLWQSFRTTSLESRIVEWVRGRWQQMLTIRAPCCTFWL